MSTSADKLVSQIKELPDVEKPDPDFPFVELFPKVFTLPLQMDGALHKAA